MAKVWSELADVRIDQLIRSWNNDKKPNFSVTRMYKG